MNVQFVQWSRKACSHTYMHTCMHTYMQTCIHAYMHACLQLCFCLYNTWCHTWMRVFSSCVCVVCNANIKTLSQEDLQTGQTAVYTHYFESKCNPEFPKKQVIVKEIERKKKEYLKDVKNTLELEQSKISSVKSRAIKEVKIKSMR